MFCIQQHIHIFFYLIFFTSSWLRVDQNGYSCKQTAYRNIAQSTRRYLILVWYEGQLCDLRQVISIVRVLFEWSLLVVARGTCSWASLSPAFCYSRRPRSLRREGWSVRRCREFTLWDCVLYVAWLWVSPRPLGVWAQSKFTDKLWHTDSVTLMSSIWKSIITNIDWLSKR